MLERKTLIKNLAIGFLPIFVFIAADQWFGLTVGIIAAVAFGMIEAAVIYFRERRLDTFLLFDTGLIVLLGLVSLLLQNDLFFKIKPAMIELIVVILLGVCGFSSSTILLRMTGRYLKGVSFSSEQVSQMRSMMRRMFYVFALHTALILYAAFFLSTTAWGFISGGLFYLIVGILFVWEFGRAYYVRRRVRREMAGEEWFDIVTPEGKVTGRAPRSVVHGDPKLLHPVVHVHIINSPGEIFLQKRSDTKDLYPGRWDTAVGGHVQSGEGIERALHREAEEELGISMGEYQPLFRYVHRNSQESELVHGFLLRDDGPFHLNREEIAEGRFWGVSEIERALGKDVFTSNFEKEFELLRKYVLKRTPQRGKG